MLLLSNTRARCNIEMDTTWPGYQAALQALHSRSSPSRLLQWGRTLDSQSGVIQFHWSTGHRVCNIPMEKSSQTRAVPEPRCFLMTMLLSTDCNRPFISPESRFMDVNRIMDVNRTSPAGGEAYERFSDFSRPSDEEHVKRFLPNTSAQQQRLNRHSFETTPQPWW